MEFIIVILLIYVIFRDIFREDIITFLHRKKNVDEEEEKRIKATKQEFNNMMEYSIDKAINSKRSETDGE